jgi:hypothetical protein
MLMQADRRLRHIRLTRVAVDLKDAALLPLLQLHVGGCTPAAVPSGSGLSAAANSSAVTAAPTVASTGDAAADGDAEHGSTKQQQQQQQPRWKKANCSFGGMISWRNHPHAAAAAAQQRGLSTATGQQQQQVPWVATGKHLCGAATDFALRACYNAITLRLQPNSSSGAGGTPDNSQPAAAAGGTSGLCTASKPAVSDTSSSSSACSNLAAVEQSEQYPLQGLAVATCCHHRCGWAAYVGKEQLAQHGLGREEFETVAWCTSECWRAQALPRCLLHCGCVRCVIIAVGARLELLISGSVAVVALVVWTSMWWHSACLPHMMHQ